MLIEWVSEDGSRVQARGVTVQLSVDGALLRLWLRGDIPAKIRLHCLSTDKWASAEAVWTESVAPDGSTRVAVALRDTPESFWGLWNCS
ncbi:MAG: hypothetical protein L0338_21610 [Acidobacteria bacterium]|nr:hypothetical protein [Acidobacteriota bacterium]